MTLRKQFQKEKGVSIKDTPEAIWSYIEWLETKFELDNKALQKQLDKIRSLVDDDTLMKADE